MLGRTGILPSHAVVYIPLQWHQESRSIVNDFVRSGTLAVPESNTHLIDELRRGVFSTLFLHSCGAQAALPLRLIHDDGLA